MKRGNKMTKIKVYANKVYRPANVVTDDIIYLGDIEADSFPVAFIKAMRLYNKKANKGIFYPMFKWKGVPYRCDYYGEMSKRGIHHLYTIHEDQSPHRQFLLSIPKSKVNNPNWRYYLE